MRLIEQVLHDLTVQTQSKVTVILTKHCFDQSHSHNSQMSIRDRLAQKSPRNDMTDIYVIHGETNSRIAISLRVSLTFAVECASPTEKLFKCR